MGDVEKIISSVDKFVKIVESSPSLSTVVRITAKRNGIDDITPLRTEEKIQYVETGLKPSSELHESVFKELNKLKPEELQNLLKQGENVKSDSGKPEN